MAYTNVEPTSDAAEKRMRAVGPRIQDLIRTCIGETWGVPEKDRLVMLCKNNVLVLDPTAKLLGVIPDLLIKIYTSDTDLQPLAETLKENILRAWEAEFGTSYQIEIWIDFFDTWGTNIDLT